MITLYPAAGVEKGMGRGFGGGRKVGLGLCREWDRTAALTLECSVDQSCNSGRLGFQFAQDMFYAARKRRHGLMNEHWSRSQESCILEVLCLGFTGLFSTLGFSVLICKVLD